jgi:hypothetical protein
MAKNKTDTSTSTLGPTEAAQAAVESGVPTGQTTGKKGLTGVPLGTPVAQGVKPRKVTRGSVIGTEKVYGKTQYSLGDGQIVFATKNNKERVELLLRLANIPGLYKEGEAYTPEQLAAVAQNQIIPIRRQDSDALEKVMFLADTTGDNYETTLTAIEANPALALASFGAPKGKKTKLTPADALGLELEQSIMDYLDLKVSDADKKAYAKRVNQAESKRGGALTELERREILNDTIQDKARQVFKATGEDAAALMRRGALGETYDVLRQTYRDYGQMADDNTIYKQAIQSIRSKQALDNIINKVKLQAEVSMPALKSYIQQGLTPREALGSYINYYSKAMGTPADQVDLTKLMPVVSGTSIMPFQDWQRYIQKLPEFKNGPLFREQQFSDAQALRRNFLG